MNMFKMTAEDKEVLRTTEAKKPKTGGFINKSGVYQITVTDAEAPKKEYGEGVTFTFENESGAKAKWVLVKYADKKGNINEEKLQLIRDIVEITGVEYDGTNPEVFIDAEFSITLKVIDEGKKYPTMYMNHVYYNDTKKTVRETLKEVEASSWEYWKKALEKDEPVSVKRDEQKPSTTSKAKTSKADKFSKKPKPAKENKKVVEIDENDPNFPF